MITWLQSGCDRPLVSVTAQTLMRDQPSVYLTTRLFLQIGYPFSSNLTKSQPIKTKPPTHDVSGVFLVLGNVIRYRHFPSLIPAPNEPNWLVRAVFQFAEFIQQLRQC